MILRLLQFLCILAVVAATSAGEELTVSAAASLRDVLQNVESERPKSGSIPKVAFNFGGSGTLQRQIEAGAPVDVFISAAPEQMDALERGKLLAGGTRRNLIGNSLVLIAPAGKKEIRDWPDLARGGVGKIIIGEPRSVPAGKYAAEVFAKLGLAKSLEPKLVRALNVRQVLAAVAAGDADAGLVYATDARLSDRVRVVADAPEGSHSPILYAAAVITGSRQAGAARAYLEYLSSERARAVFAKFGFRMPE